MSKNEEILSCVWRLNSFRETVAVLTCFYEDFPLQTED